MEHDYLEAEFLGKYNRKFVKKLMKETYKKKFRFPFIHVCIQVLQTICNEDKRWSTLLRTF